MNEPQVTHGSTTIPNGWGRCPAYPFPASEGICGPDCGMRMLDRFAIDMLIPCTDDSTLNALIRQARRREMASTAMHGLLAASAHERHCGYGPETFGHLIQGSIGIADAMLAELDAAADLFE